ncbi:hypothetical protein SUGI_0227380 [Cryptomeria japonica]|nr:hypothetical protein SUGI_0227380 [Cryptomeria japonica]
MQKLVGESGDRLTRATNFFEWMSSQTPVRSFELIDLGIHEKNLRQGFQSNALVDNEFVHMYGKLGESDRLVNIDVYVSRSIGNVRKAFEQTRYLFFDLGGGTFDVIVVEVGDDGFKGSSLDGGVFF